MKIAVTWDDGAPEDVRLFALHRKYDIPGMFFVPTKNSEGRAVLTGEQIREHAGPLVSFGGHTQNHVYLTEIPRKDVEREITDNKKYLEDILQKEIEHFCFPGGKYTEEIKQTAFRHFRTVRTADTMNFKKPENFIVKPAIHFYPRGIRSLAANGIRQRSCRETVCVMRHRNLDYFDLLKIMIEMAAGEHACLVIWGHSWEIESLGLWNKLDDLFRFLRDGYQEFLVDYASVFE